MAPPPQPATYYLHVRAQADAARAFATIGPYSTQAEAKQAAIFAKLAHWTVERRIAP
jgi:hypothetical protein